MPDYISNHTGVAIDTAVSKSLAAKFADQSTGILANGSLSINVNDTLFDLGFVSGQVVNSTTDTANPTLVNISYAGGTGLTVDNLATNDFTHLYLSGPETILQSTVEPTPQLRRDNVYIGKLIHLTRTRIEFASDQPEVIINTANAMVDFFRGLGLVVLDGNRISANGVNLSINKSGGHVHQSGINYDVDKKSPNVAFLPGQTPVTFLLATQTDTGVIPLTVIDPTVYDNGGVVTPIIGSNNQATNYRVYLFNSGLVGVQYGQQVYSTLAGAIAGLQSEPFAVLPNVADNAVLVSVISVQKGATDLSDIGSAKFSPASKLGEIAAGTGASSVSTMQDTYNNSVTPQILISAILGALVKQSGTGDDTDAVEEIKNNAGVTTYSIDGNGSITASGLKSGANQGAAGALVNELWKDTTDNTVKVGV